MPSGEVKNLLFNLPESWRFVSRNPGAEALPEHWGKLRRARVKAIEEAKRSGRVKSLDVEPPIYEIVYAGKPLYFFPFGGSYCVSCNLDQIKRYRRRPGSIRW
jgi:hypothetical protein